MDKQKQLQPISPGQAERPGESGQAGQPGRGANRESQDGQRLRNLAVNMLFGLALVDDGLRLVRFNDKFKNFSAGRAASGKLLCDVLQKDCSVPDGCESCPVRRSLKSGVNHEREFARQLAGGAEQSFRFVATPARVASSGRAAGSAAEESAGGGREGLQGAPDKAEAAARKSTAQPENLTLVLLEDITRKRFIEQKLLRAQRLEAMSTLAGGIAHEINQPLSALNLYASGLHVLLDKEELPAPQVIRERVGLILEQARKISEITQHMRSMAIQSATVYEEVEVEGALQAAVQAVRGSLEKDGVEVDLLIINPADGGDLPKVKAIGVQLNQVLGNLLSNAAHAIGKRRAEEPGAPGLIRIRARLDNQRVLLEVADSGVGILPGQERRIFDPFYTTKGPSDGMGLGLSLVHAFVSSWGGEVLVRGKDPELGGAVFGISLNVIASGGFRAR